MTDELAGQTVILIGGSAGIAGAVGVYVVSVITRAFIGRDPLASPQSTASTFVLAHGNVLVSASEATKQLGIAGNLSGAGAASVGAAAGAERAS
ncbi:MAG: hypothetical protein JNL44_18435 [Gemmatimonadetes bacterium]|nr:hypothetical protein [Gemmatimonadota bacterium]